MQFKIYSWFLRNCLLSIGDQITGQQMMNRLRMLEKAQWWPRDQILAYRDQLLQETIQIAYDEVIFYTEIFKKCGLNPSDIQTSSDLVKLPIITKDLLRENYPTNTTRTTGQKTYEVCTSGSTGKNFCLQEDAHTAGWYRATLMLALEWAGWEIGEAHLQTGMTIKRSYERKLKDFFMRCHYVSAYDLTDHALKTNLELIEKHHLENLWGYPGSLYWLAKYALQIGWNRPMQSVVTWGDTLYIHYRKTIEQAFQTKVFDTYGCSEGFHVAAQCGAGDHYHIHNLDVVAEFIDDQGQPVSHGTPGNVIITRLHAGPMPLIRYKVGDIAVPGSGVCSCGRGFELMNNIQGRDTDIVITPAGNRLIVHFFTGILEHFSEIDSFQVIQEDVDVIQLKIIPRTYIDSDIEKKIVRALKEKGVDDLRINLQIVSDIPIPPSGKRRFVINKIGK